MTPAVSNFTAESALWDASPKTLWVEKLLRGPDAGDLVSPKALCGCWP